MFFRAWPHEPLAAHVELSAMRLLHDFVMVFDSMMARLQDERKHSCKSTLQPSTPEPRQRFHIQLK